MKSLFKNQFPGINYQKTITNHSFKRAVLYYYNKSTKLVEIRNYFIRKNFTGVSKNIKKIVNNNSLLNFEDCDDVADMFINDNDASESDLDFLPNSKMEIEEKVLGEKKKQKVNIRLYVSLLGNGTKTYFEIDQDRRRAIKRRSSLSCSQVQKRG